MRAPRASVLQAERRLRNVPGIADAAGDAAQDEDETKTRIERQRPTQVQRLTRVQRRASRANVPRGVVVVAAAVVAAAGRARPAHRTEAVLRVRRVRPARAGSDPRSLLRAPVAAAGDRGQDSIGEQEGSPLGTT
jgi:hypothetical protein